MRFETHTLSLLTRQFVVLSAALGAALLFVAAASAWTGPTTAPPGGNVPAPVNVGTTPQAKDGNLGLGTLLADQICLGNPAVCKTAWPAEGGNGGGSGGGGVPDCRLCIEAGVSNGVWGKTGEQCVAFNGGYLETHSESSHSGRGTAIRARVVCP